ncbi:MAG: error-prone DNA polymerase, partial [Gammaproteobacteria bacterium]
MKKPGYAELHCLSNFTFLRGASSPAELVEQAISLGYKALALTDECSVAGIVRAWQAAQNSQLSLITGSEFRFSDGLRLVLLAANRQGYGQLCSLITRGRRNAEKGSYHLDSCELNIGLQDCLALWLPSKEPQIEDGIRLKKCFPGQLWIAVELLADGHDRRRLTVLQSLGRQLTLPLVAAGDVHMHVRRRRALQDTLTAIRIRSPVSEAGLTLYPNGERHLRSRERLAAIYPEELLVETTRVAERCCFSLDELRYEYPSELVPSGETPRAWLRRLTWEGMVNRWPEGVPDTVRQMVEHELALISELRYEAYFLTVHDIVRFARAQQILCQGRGSAANSAVCFCLGITEVDPARMSLLFERFISRERDEPPDIDVDFEHERREEVISYIYGKYGRGRAALSATVITYRPRSAIRDVGKALGFDALQIEQLSKSVQWWDGKEVNDDRVREAGFDPGNPLVERLLELVRQIIGFPRHLSQHVGGFVISAGPLSELVPIENAAMDNRTVIQWDKNDLDALGLIKVDILALGMLSAIRRSFDLIAGFRRRNLTLATVPAENPAVYDMICRADTLGVFQIESRAQMAMLPRLRPRCFYDLVIEVAIIRPGPIQGDMVHPYLRRRNGEEPVTFPSEEVRAVLERTLGVPIFQEQVMQLAVVAAGFTPGEADQLRRAMAAWRRNGNLGPFEDRLICGMRERGYKDEYAHRIFDQIQGFGEYGFPESHSASFALLVYVSAWLKRHEPAVFACALLNSQPMGFYAPSQIVRDAIKHGVDVRPVDIFVSQYDCSLEEDEEGNPALRLGLRLASHLSDTAIDRISLARKQGPWRDLTDLATRAELNQGDLEALAAAGALQGLGGHRHRVRWEVAGVEDVGPLLDNVAFTEAEPLLHKPTEGQDIVADYKSLGLTLRRHPLALLRGQLSSEQLVTSEELRNTPDGYRVSFAGIVITRQRPGSASGVTFVTLEDETGHVNIIVWKTLAENQRRELLAARLMEVKGKVQREGEVLHLIAE